MAGESKSQKAAGFPHNSPPCFVFVLAFLNRMPDRYIYIERDTYIHTYIHRNIDR